LNLDLSRARILVVDDDEANLRLLDQILRPVYPAVELISDARRVVDRFVEFAPDLVLVDLHMPHFDGFAVLTAVRALTEEGAFLPVVVLTADATGEAKRRALALGATDYLTKPLDITEVALRVTNLVKTRLLHRRLQERSEELEVAVSERTHQLESVNQQLSDLIRSKDEFVAAVSHELRTPLSVVVGLAAELRDAWEEFGREATVDLVRMIAEQSAEVAFIVEDLLVAARAEIDAVSVIKQQIDVADEVSMAIRPFPAQDRSRITVNIEQGMTAEADAVRFRQIIRNLVSNAVRYGGQKIAVGADWSPGSGWVTVTVADDGPRIERAQWEKIFDAYHTAHRNGTPASVGLGLTVSRQLARLMAGELDYHHNGSSSVFEVRLPAWSTVRSDAENSRA
jgi:two-component system, sensor histidine kinase and response regulator